MKHTYFLWFFLISLCAFTSEGPTERYEGIIIGTQEWMMDNLNVSVFQNGEKISQAKTSKEWEDAGIKERAVWCYYNFDSINGNKFGKLYNWYAVNDKRGLAPKGWHVATDAEWLALIDHLEGNEKAGVRLKSSEGWDNSANGNNNAVFTALPAGFCDMKGSFEHLGCTAYFWTSTQVNKTEAMDHYITCEFIKMGTASSNKRNGYSCRCVKNQKR